MSGSDDFDGLAAYFREQAIHAGVPADILDGPARCFAGCGTIVTRGTETCPTCTEARIHAEHNESMRRAWATVPETLRWAALNVPRIASWVRDADAVRAARAVAAEKVWRTSIVLTGEPGAGKTTLACALLREWMLPGARKGANGAARARSRKSRFTTAHGLVEERAATRLGEHVVGADLAREASMLVLDEVGRGVDTHGVIFSLIHERHAHGRPTIMTTPFATAEELSRVTDGGLARRVFDDALVIHVRKVAT